MPISKLSLILYAKITAPLAKILLNDTWLGEEYTPAPSEAIKYHLSEIGRRCEILKLQLRIFLGFISRASSLLFKTEYTQFIVADHATTCPFSFLFTERGSVYLPEI